MSEKLRQQSLPQCSAVTAFDEYERQYEAYLEDLLFRYVEHFTWWELGFVPLSDFRAQGFVDEYHENLYCMSWFYDGLFPFENWECAYEEWLGELGVDAMDGKDAAHF